MDINKLGVSGLAILERELNEGESNSNESNSNSREYGKTGSLETRRVNSEPSCNKGTFTDTEEHGAMRPLWNGTEPTIELKRESPRHRRICVLKAAGLNNKEIAELVGVTAATVGYTVTQPHGVQVILEEMGRQGNVALKVIQQATQEAAETLIEVMRVSQNLETKRKAANDILDRQFGKPNQPVSLDTKPADQMTDEELARLAQSGSN